MTQASSASAIRTRRRPPRRWRLKTWRKSPPATASWSPARRTAASTPGATTPTAKSPAQGKLPSPRHACSRILLARAACARATTTCWRCSQTAHYAFGAMTFTASSVAAGRRSTPLSRKTASCPQPLMPAATCAHCATARATGTCGATSSATRPRRWSRRAWPASPWAIGTHSLPRRTARSGGAATTPTTRSATYTTTPTSAGRRFRSAFPGRDPPPASLWSAIRRAP